MATTSTSVLSGSPAATMVSATRRAPRTAARSVSASAAPTWSWSSSPALSAIAIRRISRRRISRISRMALSGSACRDIFDAISSHCASKVSGTSSLSEPSQATDSGETSSRSAISRELESTWQSRSAAAVESRSMPRYQWVVPSASLTRRKASRPASGSTPSASQPSRIGSSWRWSAARRLTPPVSASMCRMAPLRIEVAQARRGAPARLPGVSRASSLLSAAAVFSSGR